MLLKTSPPALAAPDHYDLDDITAMLREIGAGLIEVAQPIQVVETRLVEIAAKYTTEPLEVAAFPTMLLIQIGGKTFRLRLEGSVQPSGQFDTAASIDQIADLVVKRTRPQASTHGDPAWRRQLAGVFVKRALARLRDGLPVPVEA